MNYVEYIPYAIAGVFFIQLTVMIVLLFRKNKVEVVSKEADVTVSFTKTLDNNFGQLKKVIEKQRSDLAEIAKSQNRDMKKFVNEIVTLQSKPVVEVKPPEKESNKEYGLQVKDCPYYESPCQKAKCIAYHVEGGKAKCAAMGDIILEKLK